MLSCNTIWLYVLLTYYSPQRFSPTLFVEIESFALIIVVDHLLPIRLIRSFWRTLSCLQTDVSCCVSRIGKMLSSRCAKSNTEVADAELPPMIEVVMSPTAFV